MSEFIHDTATAQRAREVIRKLIGVRDEIATGDVAFEAVHRTVARPAWSWWMLITDSARIVLDEADKGYGFVVAPVMRNLINHTTALQWLVEGGESALKALDAYSDEQLLKLIDNVRRVGWEGADGPFEQKIRDAVAARDANPDAVVTKLYNEIKSVETLLTAYGVPAGYVPYRHLSSYTHTSRETAQLYLSKPGEAPTLLDSPRDSGLNDVLWASVCLIQAGRVMDGILAGKPLTEVLDEASAYLGVPRAILPERRRK